MRIKTLTGVLAISLLCSRCTKDFGSINTDPNQQSPATFNAEYFLASSQNEYKGAITGYESGFIFESGWAQILGAPSTGYLSNMDKYVESSNTNDYASRAWNDCYRAAGYADAIIQKHKDDGAKTNLVSAATVMKVLSLQYITDMYGDIPYTEALKGFDGTSLGTIFPPYDNQQAIYMSMLSELDVALTNFNTGEPGPTADLMYHGDITKWKKFGYSLMLRMAMRLTKVDAATAQSYAEKAYAGGVFTSNDDNALLKGENATGHGSENPRVLTLAGDIEYIRWGKEFINYLKSTSDPRLPVISEVVDIAAAVDIAVTPTVSNTTPADQFGVPNGYVTNNTSPYYIATEPDYPGAVGAGTSVAEILGKYSRPRRALYYDLNGPIFFLSYTETSLLLAEAKFRGWNVGSLSAQDYYQQGIAAALGTYSTFSASAGAIDAAAITAYASSQTLTAGKELELINTQLWLSEGSFLNFTEAWTNWRRSGYPELTPVTYPGQFANATIPRRHIYPTSESTTNSDNYQAAVGNLDGGDKWTSRVWWDK